VQESDFGLSDDEKAAIARLSALEGLREEARRANRAAMIDNVEKLIEAELRAIHRLRSRKPKKADHPGV
jgi:hypothetical protein